MTEKVQLPDEVWSMTEEEYLQFMINGISDGTITRHNMHCYCSHHFRNKHRDKLNHACTVRLFEVGQKVLEEECKRLNIPFTS